METADVPKPWHAVHNPTYHTDYVQFLQHLYEPYHETPGDNHPKDSLLKVEADHFLNADADFKSTFVDDFAQVRQYLATSSFSPAGQLRPLEDEDSKEEVPSKKGTKKDDSKSKNVKPDVSAAIAWSNDLGGGWSYLETAYRVRMMFAALFSAAEHTGRDGNYLEMFFARIEVTENLRRNERELALLQSIFPPEIRTRLLSNQARLNSHIRGIPVDTELGTELPEGHFQAKASFPLKNSDGGLEVPLVLPYSHASVRNAGQGPIGPVSLEVALILALQLAGINLRSFAAFRQGIQSRQNDESAPQLCSAAVFTSQIKPDCVQPPPEVQTLPQGELYDPNTKVVHTSVRRQENQQTWTSNGIGFYLGIDLYRGADKFKGLEKDNKRKYFSFAMHAVDAASAPVAIDMDTSDPVGGAAPRFWVVSPTGPTQPKPADDYPKLPKTCQEPAIDTAGLLPDKRIMKPLAAQGNDKQGLVVRPHCHAGYWPEDAFRRHFEPGYNFASKPLPFDGKTPQYEAIGKFHMYLISEHRPTIHPRASAARQRFAYSTWCRPLFRPRQAPLHTPTVRLVQRSFHHLRLVRAMLRP